MSSQNRLDATIADTANGPVQYSDEGGWSPVLFIHGSPGGFDQGALMARFLLEHGHRIIAISRPDYLGTPLSGSNATPGVQADLAGALMDSLGIERFALDLMGTIVGDRRAGFENDVRQFPNIDLDLPSIETRTLLVHATADADVPIEHSENALARLPHADIIRIEDGTHLSAWTEPGSEAVRARIAGFVATP